jgi:RNA polymerase sigma factor (sigma-70 family)
VVRPATRDRFAHFSGEPNEPAAAYLADGSSLVMGGDWDVMWSSVTTVVMGDAEMAAEFAAGSADAVRAVYQTYGSLVYSVAFKVLGDASLAEDATQQAFLQAWRAASSYDPARALGPWLATIARRAAIDVYRRTRRHETHGDLESAEATLVSHPPSLDELYEMWEVRRAVDSLPAEDQEVVRLHHFAGMSHTEISEQLHIPLGTVKSRTFRAHRRLVNMLAHLRGGDVMRIGSLILPEWAILR